jgi:hypothetical protein
MDPRINSLPTAPPPWPSDILPSDVDEETRPHIESVDRQRSPDGALLALLVGPPPRAKTLEPPPAVPDAAADTVVAAYERYGSPGVVARFVDDPSTIAPFANLLPAQLERSIADAVQRVDVDASPSSIAHPIDEAVVIVLRGRIATHARERANDHLGEVRAMQADVPGNVDRLRHAEPESSDARLARDLGVHGDAGDAARLTASLDRLERCTERLIQFLESPTQWRNGDFPAAGFHVAETLGFPLPSAGTVAELAIGDGNTEVATRRWIDMHRRGVTQSAAGLAKLSGSPALGHFERFVHVALALHHSGLWQRENLVALGRTLGL